jgi:hypothetical protein
MHSKQSRTFFMLLSFESSTMLGAREYPALSRLLEQSNPDVVLVFDRGNTNTAQQNLPVVIQGKLPQLGRLTNAESTTAVAYCHSQMLSISSAVLKDVIESTDTSSTVAWEGKKVIPLPGTSKQQWMHIAPFLYPPAADVAEAVVDWDNLEAVLVLGHKYDMKG